MLALLRDLASRPFGEDFAAALAERHGRLVLAAAIAQGYARAGKRTNATLALPAATAAHQHRRQTRRRASARTVLLTPRGWGLLEEEPEP